MKAILASALVAEVLLLACAPASAQLKDDEHAAMMLAWEGSSLTKGQAAELEEALKADPKDLDARTKLLGYYLRRSFRDPAARRSHTEHALWVIQNAPASASAGIIEARLDPVREPDGYAQGKALWLQNAKDHAGEVSVLGNAASFFLISDKPTAEDLLKQAREAAPKDPRWPLRLSEVKGLELLGARGQARIALAREAFGYRQMALDLEGGDPARFEALDDLATYAFEAEQWEKARALAKELLAVGERHPDDGDATHRSNLLLGRLALRDGDIEAAKRHLLAAGKTKGSPVLGSFGPGMSLARELLEKGEKDVVLEYLALCASFWERDGGRLDEWRRAVTDGTVPDFGANDK